MKEMNSPFPIGSPGTSQGKTAANTHTAGTIKHTCVLVHTVYNTCMVQHRYTSRANTHTHSHTQARAGIVPPPHLVQTGQSEEDKLDMGTSMSG